MSRIEHIGEATLYLGALFGMMYLPMLSASHQLQILNSIICFVIIFMMDYFIGTKRAAKVFFHDHTMQPTPSILPMVDGCKSCISLRIMRHSGAKKAFTRFTDSLSLKASATFSYSFSERPFRNSFFFAAVTSAKPIVQSLPLGIISDNNQAIKAKPCQIRDAIGSPILSIGG